VLSPVVAQRRKHSQKPEEVYDRIEALVDGPYLEMFARQSRPGWKAWGNEANV
jgi:N6-adenosine-specific RNA methylase IME4